MRVKPEQRGFLTLKRIKDPRKIFKKLENSFRKSFRFRKLGIEYFSSFLFESRAPLWFLEMNYGAISQNVYRFF